ncbi:hypothetical protein [Amedibacterium intestinale]|uniref:hypothetical protein n=1 Tax=Amedibacterium intestinale TaxID=2583452 RepID=UPI000E1FB8A2
MALRNKKKMMICLFILALICISMTGIHASEFSIENINESVREYLEINDFFTGILRTMGDFIYSLLSPVLNVLQDGFLALAKWDIMSVQPLKNIQMSLKDYTMIILPLSLCICILIKVFKVEQPLKVLFNTFLTVIFISVFASVMSMAFDLKNATVDSLGSIVGTGDNSYISETLYADNTVDLERSIRANRVVKLPPTTDMKKYNYNALIDHDVLNNRFTIENGTEKTEDLDSGFMGFFKENYYAYKTDYFAVNITLLCSILVYGFALYKLAYLIGETGKAIVGSIPFMLKGVNDYRHVGNSYLNAISPLIAICVLYFSMLFFTILSSAVLSARDLDNWLLKGLVVFAVGMSMIAGSGFFNDKLGVDDGSRFAFRSMFIGRSMLRSGKGLARAGKHAVENVASAGKSAVETGGKLYGAYQDSLNENKIRSNFNTWQQEQARMKENPYQNQLESKDYRLTDNGTGYEPNSPESFYGSDMKQLTDDGVILQGYDSSTRPIITPYKDIRNMSDIKDSNNKSDLKQTYDEIAKESNMKNYDGIQSASRKINSENGAVTSLPKDNQLYKEIYETAQSGMIPKKTSFDRDENYTDFTPANSMHDRSWNIGRDYAELVSSNGIRACVPKDMYRNEKQMSVGAFEETLRKYNPDKVYSNSDISNLYNTMTNERRNYQSVKKHKLHDSDLEDMLANLQEEMKENKPKTETHRTFDRKRGRR